MLIVGMQSQNTNTHTHTECVILSKYCSLLHAKNELNKVKFLTAGLTESLVNSLRTDAVLFIADQTMQFSQC